MRLMKDKGIEELLIAAQRIHERQSGHPVSRYWEPMKRETRQLYEPRVKALEEKRCHPLLRLSGRCPLNF